MRRLPPLNALRAFEAAARHENISKAASELNVSHSAVSQQVKKIEQHFRQSLFRRSGNRIVLTQRAKLFLNDVRFCLERLAVASESLAAAGDSMMLRVNATPSFAMRWLIPRIAGFQRDHPNIEIRVETSVTDEISHLGAGYDLIVRRYKMERPGMICERILEDVSVAVMSPTLVESIAAQDPSDLLRAPLLHMKSRMAAWSQWFEAASVPTQETLQGQIHDHYFLSLEAAISGVGVALAPRSLVVHDLAEGRLVAAFPEVSLVGQGFHGLINSDDRSAKLSAPFLQWLIEEGNRDSTEMEIHT